MIQKYRSIYIYPRIYISCKIKYFFLTKSIVEIHLHFDQNIDKLRKCNLHSLLCFSTTLHNHHINIELIHILHNLRLNRVDLLSIDFIYFVKHYHDLKWTVTEILIYLFQILLSFPQIITNINNINDPNSIFEIELPECLSCSSSQIEDHELLLL